MIVGIRDDNLFAAANAEPVRGIEVGRADSQLAELAPEVTRKKIIKESSKVKTIR